MKNFLTIIGIVVALFVVIQVYNEYKNGQTVKVTEFREAHDLLNKRIDSLSKTLKNVEANVDTLKTELREMEVNVDTLKKGQAIIYGAVQDVNNKTNRKVSFFDLF